MTNAVRHARAQHLRLSLIRRKRTGRLVLEIRDDGVGFEPGTHAAARSLGLRGMAQRASLAGATLEVRSRPGEGTRVIMRCAWPGGDRPC
jgi:signal transduction histidine kinase